MPMVGDFIVQTANNPGTGTFSLIAPPAGRTSWVVQIGTGQQVYYFANDGASWEVGIGTLTAGSPDTLSRDTVIHNSLNTLAKINFTALVTLVSDTPASRDVWANGANDAILVGSRKLSGLVAGVAVDDAPRMDQVAWKALGTYGQSSGVLIVPLPAGFTEFRLNLRAIIATGENPAVFRISTDGGVSYHSGASDYTFEAQGTLGTTISAGNASTSYQQISDNCSPSFGAHGEIQFDYSSRTCRTRMAHLKTSGGLGIYMTTGYTNFLGTPTHISVAVAGYALTAGECRLEGLV